MSRTFDFTSAVSDEREPKGGWCKGGYTCVCKICGSSYFGDKRSYSCADCAYSAPTPHTDGNGWQPIETAPRNGTDVLCVCMWVKPGCERYLGHMEVDCWKDRYHGFGKFNSKIWPATHWQPLPKPPVSPPKAEGESE